MVWSLAAVRLRLEGLLDVLARVSTQAAGRCKATELAATAWGRVAQWPRLRELI